MHYSEIFRYLSPDVCQQNRQLVPFVINFSVKSSSASLDLLWENRACNCNAALDVKLHLSKVHIFRPNVKKNSSKCPDLINKTETLRFRCHNSLMVQYLYIVFTANDFKGSTIVFILSGIVRLFSFKVGQVHFQVQLFFIQFNSFSRGCTVFKTTSRI